MRARGRSRGWLAVVAAWAVVAWAVAAAPAARADWFVDDPDLPAEACETYALVEALAMQRAPSGNAPLVFNADTALPVITGDSLQYAMAPGMRLRYGRHGPTALGWELGYVGVWGMYADQQVGGADNLEVAGLLAGEVTGLRTASIASATATSAFDSAEANLLLTRQNWKDARTSAYAHDEATRIITWDWLAGFRWAGLTEGAAVTMTQAGGLADTYAVRTSNGLFGGQIGFRGRADWGAWAVDGWLQAALAGSQVSQTQTPVVDSVTGDVFRPGWGARTAGLAGIFDVDVAVSRRIAEHWSIRIGWNSIWLTGVALAANQFDFSASQAPGTGVGHGGTLWLNGVTLGAEGRW